MDHTFQNQLRGAEFIIKDQSPETVFVRENLNEDARQFSDMINEFIDKKVSPFFQKLDKGDHEIVPELMKEAGELGLLSVSLPEEYGGMNVDFNSETAVSEELGKSHSFSVAFAAHTGIGTLPILYFGTENQKKAYLSDLGSGIRFASYCLTEPGSGSDALGAKTKAVLSPDGQSYIINGQKMWITNAGFADVFTVFAKIDGDKFTAFIVDKNTPGLTLGAEEDKLGIKGSSTRMVFFENVVVPKEAVLGEIGKGHKIAFNVLNIGRYKLCVMALGGMKKCLALSTKYAVDRYQFGQSISSFGAIQHKLAEMAIRIFTVDSATYRTSGLIEDLVSHLVASGVSKPEAKLKAAEEYSVECAILKVIGSEHLDYVVDEMVQIYGGMGYSEEAPAAAAYRDARINRIFEGTNEINRLLSVGTIAKKAMKGELDFAKHAMAVQKDLMNIDFGSEDLSFLAAEKKSLANAKKVFLLVAGAAFQHYMLAFEEQQELMMNLADILFEIYSIESNILRVERLAAQHGEESTQLYQDIITTFQNDSMERIHSKAKNAIVSFAEGDMMTMMLMGVKRYTKYKNVNTIAARRRIAKHIIDHQGAI